MKRFASGTQVGGGYYFNTASWTIHAVEGERGELPGPAGAQWTRIATPLMVPLALGLSLSFVLFLPAIGLWLLAGVLARAASRGVQVAVGHLAHTFAPTWVPGEAWLARRDRKPDASGKGDIRESLEEVRREVEAQRAREGATEKDPTRHE